jgi:hypothetical protein
MNNELREIVLELKKLNESLIKMQPFYPNFPSLSAEQLCEYCRLPLHKCKGHTIS